MRRKIPVSYHQRDLRGTGAHSSTPTRKWSDHPCTKCLWKYWLCWELSGSKKKGHERDTSN